MWHNIDSRAGVQRDANLLPVAFVHGLPVWLLVPDSVDRLHELDALADAVAHRALLIEIVDSTAFAECAYAVSSTNGAVDELLQLGVDDLLVHEDQFVDLHIVHNLELFRQLLLSFGFPCLISRGEGHPGLSDR